MDISGGGKNGWPNLSKHNNGGCNYNFNSTTTLRFRPIAPKPSPNGSASSSVTFDEKRTKRRYLRVNRTSRCKRKPKTTTASSSERAVLPTESKIRNDAVNTNEKQIVTLQLLPTEPVRTVSASNYFADRSLAKYAESWVTVECVTGMSTLSSLRTDDETKAALSRDTCPAFVSNGYNSNVVEWVNDAFKGVVMDGMVTEKVKVAVWLEVLDGVVLFECGAAFSCRVKWRYKKGGGMVERTLLCDTWRVGSGGFAWRLDVLAALSLGMGC